MTATTELTTTAPPGRLQSARFYITFRCNSLCGYCNVWQDDKFKGYQELTPDRARQILDELHALGVRYVDFTGGEPVLHPHIDEIVQYAKSLGMAVEITSNGIRFAKHIDAIVPYVDTMNVSLDTLRPDRYREIRGVPTLDRALDVIRRIAATGSDNLKLICVVTRENVDEVPDLLRFAHDNKVSIYFSGMFEYFDEQDTVRDVNRTARKLKLIEQNGKPLAGQAPRAHRMDESEPTGGAIAAELLRLLYQPYALINLHFRKYMETLDPTAPTDCYANKRILTVGPDGRLVLPCYHAFDNSLEWDRSLTELVQDEEFLRVRDEEVGHRSECRGCTVFPYIGLSFSYRFDKIFLYQALSEEISKIKTRFANPLHPRLDLPFDELHRSYAELERIIDEELPAPRPPASSDHFYRFDVTGSGIGTDLVAGEMGLAELLSDHLSEYCWGIQRSPHTWMRLVYRDLVPALRGLADDGLLAAAAYEDTVADLYEVHLSWWKAYMGRYFRGGEKIDTTASTAVLARFLERTATLLPDGPRGARIRQVLLHAGCVLGLPPRSLAPLAVGEPFPEAALTAKHLLLIAADADLSAYAALLPAEAAEPLLAVARSHEPGPAAPATGDHGDHGDPEVARLLLHEGDLDRTTAERLVDSVRTSVPEQRRAELTERLLASELRAPHLLRRRGEALRVRAGVSEPTAL
ncbi:radical SAM protein [Streptomyces sp. SP18CS02]|uniref:radical SAM protein n=1 Tax=Streptomyces sp. SP18CS02 TaxID=3002531 RepID=UPI002E78B2A0|nr:radical SAM protein [Streptomyces sp. SP18CS02]MEE1752159.1 radical SAM protein [Streptomyces sp. SP18CS02]